MESTDVTLENIKAACERHFAPILTSENMACDVLAGERGPSCRSVDQIPDLRKIHVRFINKCNYENIEYSDSEGESKDDSSKVDTDEAEPKGKVPKTDQRPTKYPLSLSVVDMMRLGKLAGESSLSSVVKIYHNDLISNTWSQIPTKIEFHLNSNKCGEGRFRQVFKAKCFHACCC